MKPSKGRIVLVGIDPYRNNGDDTCPAVITRVWSDTMVNLRLMPDSVNSGVIKTSVRLFDTEEEAREHGIDNACFWPRKV